MLSQLEWGLELTSQMLNSGSREAEREFGGNLGWGSQGKAVRGYRLCWDFMKEVSKGVGPSEWELRAGAEEASERDKK